MRESTGTTNKVVARRVLRSREGDVERGVPINPKMGLITFEDASDDLLNDYKVNGRKTHDHAKRRIEKHLKPAFKGKRLFSITTPVIRDVHHESARGQSQPRRDQPGTGLPEADVHAGVHAGKLHGKPHIPMLREDNVRRRILRARAVRGRQSAAARSLQPVVTFAYLTGWRLTSEILPLEWRQVDWQGRTVRLTRARRRAPRAGRSPSPRRSRPS